MRLGGPQNRSGQHGGEKILDPTGTQLHSDPSTIQPAACCCTNCISRLQYGNNNHLKILLVFEVLSEDNYVIIKQYKISKLKISKKRL
jgi:hypothetical protein